MLKNRFLKLLYLLLGGIFLVVGLFVMMIPMMAESKSIVPLIIGGLIFVFGIVFMVMFLKKDDSAQTEEEKQMEVLLYKFGNLYGFVCLAVETAIYFIFGSLSIGKILLLLAPTITTVIITFGSKKSIKEIKNHKNLFIIVFGYLLLNGLYNMSVLGALLTIILPFIVFVSICSYLKKAN